MLSVLVLLVALASPSASPAPLPTTATQQLKWMNASKAQVAIASKRLEALYGYSNAPKTLCNAAATSGVGWAQRYCPAWGQNAVYLRWSHSQGMFRAANESLQNAISALKWRTLTPAEMRVYTWGMHEWIVSEATLEKTLADDLAADVHQLLLMDKVNAATTRDDHDAAQAAVDAFAAARAKYDYPTFDAYVAFSSVNPFSFQKRAQVHTSAAIANEPVKS